MAKLNVECVCKNYTVKQITVFIPGYLRVGTNVDVLYWPRLVRQYEVGLLLHRAMEGSTICTILICKAHLRKAIRLFSLQQNFHFAEEFSLS